MKTAKRETTHGAVGRGRWGSGWRAALAGVALGVALAGCGPASVAPEPEEALAPEQASQGLASTNGISVNGISVNGISVNGISVNGLNAEALTAQNFNDWFEADPVQHETLMRYLVRCGLAEGESLTYTAPSTGVTYTWTGLLGLTPGWASGRSPTEAEQQLITACLAAHANKYGIHVPLSLLGETSKKRDIPYTQEELATYSRPEGCFFGNLFNGEGLFAGSDKKWLDAAESSARACGLSSGPHDTSSECPPLIHVGLCSKVCTLDKSKLFYETCTYNGKRYKPLTTRLRPEDVYRCGDGVCQFTEHCGTGSTWDSCKADCGECPTR